MRALVAVTALAAVATPVARASAQTGLLVVAHGADPGWNERVRETVGAVRWTGPVELAFLMGAEKESAGWAAGVARLAAAGAEQIVVVPLMVSSHGSHYRQIRFYAGELPSLPAELAGHDHGAHELPPVPMHVTAALDASPELAEALALRWRELDPEDRRRPLLLVAHGPNDSTDARRWVADIEMVSRGLRRSTGAELQVALLRDDAPPPVRAAAVAAMRDSVRAMAARAGDSVIALPVMISSGSITHRTIPRDLADLPLRYHPLPLAPAPALARWIERSARMASGAEAHRGTPRVERDSTPAL
ncbi:MAG: sirohydrochlorin chelatase [Gemmatimonadales bacterium]